MGYIYLICRVGLRVSIIRELLGDSVNRRVVVFGDYIG